MGGDTNDDRGDGDDVNEECELEMSDGSSSDESCPDELQDVDAEDDPTSTHETNLINDVSASPEDSVKCLSIDDQEPSCCEMGAVENVTECDGKEVVKDSSNVPSDGAKTDESLFPDTSINLRYIGGDK